MTSDHHEDWLYVYTERLAMLCGDCAPSEEEIEIAKRDADEYVRQLEEKEKKL